MAKCACKKKHDDPAIPYIEQIEHYCSAFEFHLEMRQGLGVNNQELIVTHEDPGPELWHRLAIAASLRKFVMSKDTVYVPNIVHALLALGQIPGGAKDFYLVGEQFNKLRKGKIGFIEFKFDSVKAHNAMTIVENVLNTQYLHADRNRPENLWSLPKPTLNTALWEGTEQLLPFMKAVYGACCQTLQRSELELAGDIQTWTFKGINDEPSGIESGVERISNANKTPFTNDLEERLASLGKP